MIDRFYIQKSDYKIGDRVKILWNYNGLYGKIGKVVGIELMKEGYKGDDAINVEIKLPNENKTHLFGESASLQNLSLKEKVVFT